MKIVSNVAKLFSQNEVLTYVKNRQYPTMVGATLFPEVKVQSLKFDEIIGASRTPVAASIHAFDTEAEIGSREGEAQTLELAFIKRKMKINEEDLMAINAPRNKAEQDYLVREVYNDIDVLVRGVLARVEAMRMEALATGKITIDENNLKGEVKYHVPEENQEILAGTNAWNNEASDPLGDILRWMDGMDVVPTRALTSRKVMTTLMRHPQILKLTNKNDIGVVGPTELDVIFKQYGLPVIRTYDETYRKQLPDGTYETHRYFPEDAFVMFGDGPLGRTLYGPTPEELRIINDPAINVKNIGKVLAMVYETSVDPVATWSKAVATAMPSFPSAGEVFQATVLAEETEEPPAVEG